MVILVEQETTMPEPDRLSNYSTQQTWQNQQHLPTDEQGKLNPNLLNHYLTGIQHELLTGQEEVELAQKIEAGNIARERLEQKDYTTLKEEIKLKRAKTEGIKSKDIFLRSNLRLVVANARPHEHIQGIDFLDLIQEGNLGLIRAVEKFDWRKGFKFSTYATWWIRQAINRAIADQSRMVRIPVHIHSALASVRSAQTRLKGDGNHQPTPEEISEESFVPLKKVKAVLQLSDTSSLEHPVGEDGAQLGDFIEDRNAADPVLASENNELIDALEQLVKKLPGLAREVLVLRYGFVDNKPMTLNAVGEQFNISRELVRHIEKRSLCQMRHPSLGLREAGLF